jgi:hypothetical protein
MAYNKIKKKSKLAHALRMHIKFAIFLPIEYE